MQHRRTDGGWACTVCGDAVEVGITDNGAPLAVDTSSTSARPLFMWDNGAVTRITITAPPPPTISTEVYPHHCQAE